MTVRRFWHWFPVSGVILLIPVLTLAGIFEPIRILPIEIKTEAGQAACSSTLLKIEDICHLLTDAHCLTGDLRAAATTARMPVRLHLPREFSGVAFLASFMDPVVTVYTTRIHRPYDLAELEIPPSLKPTCASLPNLEILPIRDLVRSSLVKTYGYVKHQPLLTISQDSDNRNSFAQSQLSVKQIAPDPDAVLIQADRMHLLPGMSGGGSTTYQDQVVGMNARYIPFQRKGMLIPIETIAHWLSQPAANDMLALALNSGGVPNETLGTLYLNNREELSGDNTTKPGVGDNEHAGGGDWNWTDARLVATEPLKPFREPHEGIQISEGGSREVLLGVGTRQIDGWDDYQNKAEGNSLPRIYLERRGSDQGFPNAAIRALILQRLAGYYRDDVQDGLHFRYVRDPHEVEGYKLEQEGIAQVTIDVNPKEKIKIALNGKKPKNQNIPTLTVYLHEHWMRTPGEFLKNSYLPTEILKFWAQLSADSKQVRLIRLMKNGTFGETLECQNDNYLKLICVSPGIEISISLDSVESREINYRVSRLESSANPPEVSYWFGDTLGAKEPDKFRGDLP